MNIIFPKTLQREKTFTNNITYPFLTPLIVYYYVFHSFYEINKLMSSGTKTNTIQKEVSFFFYWKWKRICRDLLTDRWIFEYYEEEKREIKILFKLRVCIYKAKKKGFCETLIINPLKWVGIREWDYPLETKNKGRKNKKKRFELKW